MASTEKNASGIELRAVIYREGDFWFAHCLELDIVAEGRSAADALQALFELCSMQVEAAVEANDLESVFRPAPSRFWSLYFSAGRKRRPATLKRESPIHRFDVRELVLV